MPLNPEESVPVYVLLTENFGVFAKDKFIDKYQPYL